MGDVTLQTCLTEKIQLEIFIFYDGKRIFNFLKLF